MLVTNRINSNQFAPFLHFSDNLERESETLQGK